MMCVCVFVCGTDESTACTGKLYSCVTLVTIVWCFQVLVTAHQTARRQNPEDVSTSSELYYLWTCKYKQTEQIWRIDTLHNVTSSKLSVVTTVFLICDSEKR